MGGVIFATRFPFTRRAVENNGVIMHVSGTPKKYHLMLNSQIAKTLPETVSMHHSNSSTATAIVIEPVKSEPRLDSLESERGLWRSRTV